jgi:hypothetical protein
MPDVTSCHDRLEDLTEEQLSLMNRMQTVIREKQVSVADLGTLLPGDVACRVREAIGQPFGGSDHTRAWKAYEARPAAGSPHPERTKPDFCRYNDAFGRYVYMEAWVSYLVRKLASPAEYERVLGRSVTSEDDAEAS